MNIWCAVHQILQKPSFTKIQIELIYVSQSLNVVTIFFWKKKKEISLVRFILVKQHLLL